MSALEEGSVIEIDSDDAFGHEQRGRRPALVVSVSLFQQEAGMAVVCPITTHGGTSQKARNALEVAVPPGLPVSGAILVYHLRTIDSKARNTKELGKVPRATLLTVRSRLKAMLGLLRKGSADGHREIRPLRLPLAHDGGCRRWSALGQKRTSKTAKAWRSEGCELIACSMVVTQRVLLGSGGHSISKL